MNEIELSCIVVGDVMLDTYFDGISERICPEAPVPVLHNCKITSRPGGAANLALNLDALGVKVTLLSVVGSDSEGRELTDLIAEQAPNINLCLSVDQDYVTTHKQRFLANSQQLLRVDRETRYDNSQLSLQLVNQHLTAAIDAVVISDYNKGFVNGTISDILKLCQQFRCKSFIDPKVQCLSSYEGAYCLKPNEKEFTNLFNITISDALDNPENIFEIMEKTQIENVIVTLGSKGMSLFKKSTQQLTTESAEKTSVFDVTGAGDTALATLVLGDLLGLSVEKTLALANKMAGSVLKSVGTSVLERDQINLALNSILHTNDHSGVKVLYANDSDNISKLSEKWRGETIVFTNGCFDVLHPGHYSLLKKCQNLGSKLVIGLNSDSSVSEMNKSVNELRPIFKLSDRIKNLKNLDVADAIIVFEDPTPINIINSLKPNIIVKGKDYIPSEIVGANEVLSWGGRVEVIDLMEGFSSTKIINTILEKMK